MDAAALRILDANFNRAREGLRVLEEHARFALDDAGLTDSLKHLRHELTAAGARLLPADALSCRDTPGDVGTQITTDAEHQRADTTAVASAAVKRFGESLRCIEEYGKLVDPSAAAAVEQMRYRLYSIEQEALLTSPRRRRLREARLHVLVTAELCKGDWLATCEAAMAGGADVIQLREKSLNDRELLARAVRLRAMTEAAGALLFINDRADIARLCGADGVHVGQSDLSVADVRRIAGPTVLVGKSTHSAAEITAAIEERPDYIAVGPMFASATKPDVQVAGARLLEKAAGLTDLPIVAIGGITAGNVSGLVCRSPFAVAVSHAVISASDVATAAREIRGAVSCDERQTPR